MLNCSTVRFTLLNIGNERTREKLKTSDGRGPVLYERLVENPGFYHSKPMNYLKREEREELLKMSALYCNDAK